MTNFLTQMYSLKELFQGGQSMVKGGKTYGEDNDWTEKDIMNDPNRAYKKEVINEDDLRKLMKKNKWSNSDINNFFEETMAKGGNINSDKKAKSKVLIAFNKEIEEASNDKEDIVSSYEEVIDKYEKKYPHMASDFKKDFQRASDEIEKQIS